VRSRGKRVLRTARSYRPCVRKGASR
jgi:hypothetical protein